MCIVWMFVCLYTCARSGVCMYAFVYVSIFAYLVCVQKYMWIFMCIWVCVYACMHIHVRSCMCICECVHMHAYVYPLQRLKTYRVFWNPPIKKPSRPLVQALLLILNYSVTHPQENLSPTFILSPNQGNTGCCLSSMTQSRPLALNLWATPPWGSNDSFTGIA